PAALAMPAIRTAPDAPPVLEAHGISKRYGGLLANAEIDFAVPEGMLAGVIGPNGAGKSTFFKMLTAEIVPSAGRIRFHGRDITGMDVSDVCQLGLTKTYQVNQLFTKLPVRQNLAIAALARTRGRFRPDLLRAMARVPGLEARIEETMALMHLSARADTPVSDLAYGEKRRLEIALALATGPSMLLLDEPLAGMSPAERAETVALLKRLRQGRTLVIVEHDMDAIFELAERITVLHEGRVLAEGPPEAIQNNAFVQEAYLGGALDA
ncbi:MAG: ABC transporter ATP-binding protein, partial [Rhodospirillales bacterium]|nr:ABC transporter ATP-binding protein [Rhodospirillales bacterium]